MRKATNIPITKASIAGDMFNHNISRIVMLNAQIDTHKRIDLCN